MASRDVVQYRSPQKRILDAAVVVFLVFFTVWTVLPLFVMFVSSFKDLLAAFQLPGVGKWGDIGVFFEFTPTFKHYVGLFADLKFGTYLAHSLVAAGGSAVISVVFGSMAAYSLSRINFRGKNDLFFWIISTRMAPVVAVLVPLYAIFRSAGLIGTLPGLILAYTTFNLPFAIWTLRSVIEGIPKELDEAAMIDGANTWQILTKVILPLARPGLAVTAILTWVFAWNEYLFAATLTSVHARTITTVLAEYVTVTGTNWGRLAATATLTLVPALLFLGLVQRHIVAGLTFGAVKE